MLAEQVERHNVPQGREAAEIIVGGLHVAVGEVDRAGHHDHDAGRRARPGRQQATGRDRIGGNEHIGDEIDDHVENIAGPARQHRHLDGPRDGAVDAIDDEREAKAENMVSKAPCTAASSASNAKPAPLAVRTCTEKARA